MRISFQLFLGLFGSLLIVSSPAWGQPLIGGDGGEPEFVPGELVVRLREPEPEPGGDPAARFARLQLRLQQRREALRTRLGALQVRGLAGMPSNGRISAEARARFERRAARRAARRGRRAEPRTARALEQLEAELSELSRVAVVEMPKEADVEALAAQLRDDPEVEYAHPNYIAHALFTPNDPFFSTSGSWGQVEDDLWGLKALEMETAWGSDPTDFQNAGEGVVVAVVDSGLDIDHPDIAANVWVNTGHGAFPPEIPANGIDDDQNGYIDDVNGFDFTRSIDVNGDGDYDDPEDVIFPDPIDENGHGSHVAGTIAAVGNNAQGIVGVAPKAQLMPVRGLDAGGAGTFTNLAAALVYAAVNGADVINNSWGCGFCPSAGVIEDAVRLAHDLDVVVVFAAGNGTDNAIVRSPQNMSETIAVSALTPADELTFFSSFGPLVDVGAPGGGLNSGSSVDPFRNILSLSAAGSLLSFDSDLIVAPGYLREAGTSMASPHAAGVAALLRGFDPTLSNEQVRQILRLASDPIATASPFPGHGRVNGRKVLESTINAEVFLETPATPDRETRGAVTLEGFARGTNLQNVQVSVGSGQDPTSFQPIATTYNPVTGDVSATLDSTLFTDGFAILRLSADDGVRTYESSTGTVIHNLFFSEPAASSTVSGVIDVVLNLGSTADLQRVVISYFNDLTGETETLLDTTSFSSAQLTATLDTLASLDSDQLVTRPTLTATATYLVDGQPTDVTESVSFEIDNDRIDAPRPGTRLSDPGALTAQVTTLHTTQLQAQVGASWVPVSTLAPGSFSVPVAFAALGLDLDRDNRVTLRLLADIDEDGQFEATEQNALTVALVDPDLAPAWPQAIAGGDALPGVGVTVGDVDGDEFDEAVVGVDGTTPFTICSLSTGQCNTLDPHGGIYAYEGDGTLDSAVLAGAASFQPPMCSNQVTLQDLDGEQGLEMIWASWGQIGAIRHDGQVPAGFATQVFNEAMLRNIFNHQDPNYVELWACRPVTSFRRAGERRLIEQTDLVDFNGPKIAGIVPTQLLKNVVLGFDGTTGELLNQNDKGPGRFNGSIAPNWAVADVDADGQLEVVSLRENVPVDGSVGATILIYDALTLTLDSQIEVPDVYNLSNPLLGDADGSPGLEIVFSALSRGPGPVSRDIYAFHADGTPLAGTPLAESSPYTVRALADLDGDGDAEILAATGSISDVALHAIDYDAAGGVFSDLPGWPVPLPEAFTPNGVSTILVGSIDGDPVPEVIYASRSPIRYTVGSTTSTITSLYTVSALAADGTPFNGGWTRAVRGEPSMALGNLEGGPEPDLAIASLDFVESNPALPGYRAGELLAYRFEGRFRKDAMQWTHLYGNAQQSGATTSNLEPQCSDGTDNDGDGLTDLDDGGCEFASLDDESPECSDGIDNDGDGQIDWNGGPNGEPADTNCNAGPSLGTESQGLGGCGLGFEVSPFLLAAGWIRRRRSRSRG